MNLRVFGFFSIFFFFIFDYKAQEALQFSCLYYKQLLKRCSIRMASKLEQMGEALAEINKQNFKPSGIFTNSLLSTTDPTQIIRDIRDEEAVFFLGKKMQEIDYEMISNLGFNNSDQYAQYEVSKLLQERSNDAELDLMVEEAVPRDLREDVEYSEDIEDLVAIYKRCHTIKRLWASPTMTMLDSETLSLLKNTQDKLDQVVGLLREISQLRRDVKSQTQQFNQSFSSEGR